MKGRVLILDDDPNVGQTIAFVAEAAEMEAKAVTRPEDFFRLVNQWNPTHIVLDLIMPEMDGVEIMRHLSARHNEAYIIILSGVGSRVLDAARRAAAEKGLRIAAVLSKPISTSQLQQHFHETQGTPVARKSYAPTAEERVIETDLRRAVNAEEFQLAYQPKIHCDTGLLAGFEALVRWYHPSGRMIMPDAFIPLAERVGLIDRITDQILDQGLRWMSAPGPASTLSLSINLSARTLTDLKFADRLSSRCRSAGVDPNRLILELTETTAMEDPALALDLVTRLRMKGFHVSIDDVGTGYSSMAQLARLPFSEMKVDKSFVMTASASQESRTIIESIIHLGHNLELRVAAEGVEDHGTLEFLKHAGCDYAQGFFIARPMTADRIEDWMGGRAGH